MNTLMIKRLTLTGSTLRPRTVAQKAAVAEGVRRNVWPLLASKRVRPIVHATFPLAQAAEAAARTAAEQFKVDLATVDARLKDAERRATSAERRAEFAERRAETAERSAVEARDWLTRYYDKIIASFGPRSLMPSEAAGADRA